MAERRSPVDWLCDRNCEARAARLGPTVVNFWTKRIERAAKHVSTAVRPCNYQPWMRALRSVSAEPPVATDQFEAMDRYPELMRVAEDIASPGWPTPRGDLIEFALVFMEADVMLFRSGYTKRHLAKRLQQSPLTEKDVARIEAVLRRAVDDGAGLEEFRAYCKLAAKLVCDGRLDEFAAWLDTAAQGAILSTDRADGAEYAAMSYENVRLSDLDKSRLARVNWFGTSRWGTPWPDMDRIVPAGEALRVPDQQVRKNAFYMLRAIERRKTSAT